MIYLASPYTGTPFEMEYRYIIVSRVMADKARTGVVLYSPIMHWHECAKMYNLPKSHEFWEAQDHAMIDICDEVWVLRIEGWDQSKGVTAEIAYAETRQKPVRYI